jgi:hypothetical protein
LWPNDEELVYSLAPAPIPQGFGTEVERGEELAISGLMQGAGVDQLLEHSPAGDSLRNF